MTDSTNPRVIADNVKALDARILANEAAIETNTEEIAKGRVITGTEFDTGKTLLGDTIYGICFSYDSDLTISYENNTSISKNIENGSIVTFSAGFDVNRPYQPLITSIGASGAVYCRASGGANAVVRYVYLEYTKTPPTP